MSVYKIARLILLVALSLYTSLVYAASVKGRVIDSQTRKELPLANVIIEGTSLGASQSETGGYLITGANPGKYRLIASAVGYSSALQLVEITGQETIEINFILEENPIALEDVVITGTRTPRFIKDVPVRTEVITSKAVIEKSADNIYEVLEGTPGIRVEEQCQSCNFSVLRIQGLGADHTQVLLDGQPIYSGLASVYGLQQFSTNEIDRIEVVKGAGSALYGSNAIAGAINIISIKPTRTESNIGIRFGQYGTNSYDVSASAKKTDVGVFVFAQQNTADVIDVSSGGNNRTDVLHSDGISDRVKSSSINAGFNLYLDNLLKFDQIIVRTRLLNENRQGGTIDDGCYENPFTAGTEKILTDRYSMEIGTLKRFPGGEELNISVTGVNHQRNATNDTFLNDFAATHNDSIPSVDMLRPYLAEENLYLLSANFSRPFGDAHRFLAGMQISLNDIEESGRYVIVDENDPHFGMPYTSISEKKAANYGGFVQDEVTLNESLSLVGGFRFDLHKSEDSFGGEGSDIDFDVAPVEYNESSLNPRLALMFRPNSDITIRGSVGTGFRVPYGFSEDLHLCSGSPRVWKSATLKPERSVSYGATVDYSHFRLNVNANLFYTRLTGAIGFVDAGPDAEALGYTYEWVNIDNAYVTGLELGIQYSLISDLVGGVSLTLNEGKYDNPRSDWVGTDYENQSRNIPRFAVVTSGLNLKYSPRGWTVNADLDYTGKMFIDYYQDGESPLKIKETEPFAILNMRVSRQVASGMDVYLSVDNVTDYVQPERHLDDAAFMYAPAYGRIVYGGVRFLLN